MISLDNMEEMVIDGKIDVGAIDRNIDFLNGLIGKMSSFGVMNGACFDFSIDILRDYVKMLGGFKESTLVLGKVIDIVLQDLWLVFIGLCDLTITSVDVNGHQTLGELGLGVVYGWDFGCCRGFGLVLVGCGEVGMV